MYNISHVVLIQIQRNWGTSFRWIYRIGKEKEIEFGEFWKWLINQLMLCMFKNLKVMILISKTIIVESLRFHEENEEFNSCTWTGQEIYGYFGIQGYLIIWFFIAGVLVQVRSNILVGINRIHIDWLRKCCCEPFSS